MKLKHLHSRLSRGFSALELLVILGILAVLSALIVGYYGNIHSITTSVKMDNDLKMLNSAVNGYVNFGGDLDNGETTETVLLKLKSRASESTAKTVVGVSGSFLDSRLKPVMQTSDEAASDNPRIYYNPTKRKFVAATTGPIGIKEFSLSDEVGIEEQEAEDRTSIVSYAAEGTWVWDYGTEGTPAPPEGPSIVSTTPIPVGLVPPTATVSSPENTLLLQQPIISHPSGSYPLAEFDLSVSLTNNNPPGSSNLSYSLDYADWQDYFNPITVPPGSVLRAQANPLTEEWRSSIISQANYGMSPGVLDVPSISLSSTSFSESTTTIDVTISNPNASGTSVIYYALRTPSGSYPPLNSYSMYTGPFAVSSTTYPDGFLVKAYARSINNAVWGDSGFVEEAVQASFFEVPLNGNKILFVIDASGSMNQEFLNTGMDRYQVAINELISAIAALPNEKEFGIAMFDGGQHWIYNSATLQVANTINKQAAINAVNVVDNDSGTNYEVALAYPMQFSPRPDQVIFLSDGGPNSATNWHDELAALKAAGIRVDCVGIECSNSEKANLEFIASETGGSARYLE